MGTDSWIVCKKELHIIKKKKTVIDKVAALKTNFRKRVTGNIKGDWLTVTENNFTYVHTVNSNAMSEDRVQSMTGNITTPRYMLSKVQSAWCSGTPQYSLMYVKVHFLLFSLFLYNRMGGICQTYVLEKPAQLFTIKIQNLTVLTHLESHKKCFSMNISQKTKKLFYQTNRYIIFLFYCFA